MTSKDFLRCHLLVLLAQYGEKATLETLAPLMGVTVEEMTTRLNDIEKVGQARQKKAPRPVKAAAESVESLFSTQPDKVEALRQLQARFVTRTFLPELKDVKRFLDRHGQSSSSIKKRDAAFAVVARHLVQMPKGDLEAMLAAPADSGYSSLGVISDQILGRK